MFKKTRRKIVAAIMSVLVFLFIGILVLIYGTSYFETKQKNLERLRTYAELFSLKDLPVEGDIRKNIEPDISDLILGEHTVRNGFNGSKFEGTSEYKLSAFYSIIILDDGSALVAENSKAIYSDEELIAMATEVYPSKENSGTKGGLLFYKADKGRYTLVAFMDNGITRSNIAALFKYTLIYGSIAIILFYFLARKLAKMIVSPLEESYMKQKQFISDAGHELKTPVSVVNANAELLSREIGDNPWLANIRYENERMGELITQLLELTRMENVVPQMEPVDFSRLVKGEVLPFESAVFERGMVLTCSITEGQQVYGNDTQLKQLTSILLDNAIKHSEENGEIILNLKNERGHAVLSVINDGKEIPPEQCRHLFDRFYRVDTARNDEDKHYGLGLAIAKAIATTHHGKIEVRCYCGKVEFTVRLPLNG